MDTSGDVTADAATKSNEAGYRVDVEGNIDFPILGKLHVEGLKISEVKELIKNRIEEGNYIKNPLISIEFLNFKYTVMGAVGRNGTFTANGDQVTLLEAIANAADLTYKARADRAAVTRVLDGNWQTLLHDHRTIALFVSAII